MSMAHPRPCPCRNAAAAVMSCGGGRELLRCHLCGLLSRAQLPTPEEMTERYGREYWARYREEQMGAARANVYQHGWQWLDRLRPHPGTIVDVGCGGGAWLALCQKRGWRGIGFDPSSEAVAHARASGVEAHVHAWPPCPLVDASADAVTLINVLDHVQDPFGALQEAWRVVRNGGLLYIRVPNGPLHVRLIRWLSAVGLDHLAVFHLFGFGRAALLYHLSRLGFSVVAVRTAPPSQADAYGQQARWRSVLRRTLKMTDYTAYRLLTGLTLDSRCWGLSIEAVARKIHGREDAPMQDARLSSSAS